MLEAHVKTSKWKTFGTGAAVDIVGSISSMLSNVIFHLPLGYSPLSFKNFFKVGIVSGLSTMGVMAGYDEKWLCGKRKGVEVVGIKKPTPS